MLRTLNIKYVMVEPFFGASLGGALILFLPEKTAMSSSKNS